MLLLWGWLITLCKALPVGHNLIYPVCSNHHQRFRCWIGPSIIRYQGCTRYVCLQICPPQTQSTSRPLSTFQERFCIFTESELLTPLPEVEDCIFLLPRLGSMENFSPWKAWGSRQRLHLTPSLIFVSFPHFKTPSNVPKTNPGTGVRVLSKLWWSNQI